MVRWGSERSRVRLGDVQALMGEARPAEAAYQQAIEGLEKLVTDDPCNVDFRRDLARALEGMGVCSRTPIGSSSADDPMRRARPPL